MDNRHPAKPWSVFTWSASDIAAEVLDGDRRLLLFGPPGVGKSTLAATLAATLSAAGRSCWCISADPGSPAFGVPGAVSLGVWDADAWRVTTFEALCTLDAGRFRLPLISAVRRLAPIARDGVVLIDGPGVVRGVAGRELLSELIDAAAVDAVLAFTAAGRPPPLADELHAIGAEVFVVQAAPAAKRPGKRMRARRRTARWDAYLAEAAEHRLDLNAINLVGTPPPIEAPDVWVGRQLALLRDRHTETMAEVLRLDGHHLTIRAPPQAIRATTLLVRDAQRNADGWVETARPFAGERVAYLPPADIAMSAEQSGGPRVVGRVGAVDFALVNGVFGDSLLHARIRHLRRSLLFDLGDGSRLSARVAHQVSDVFISHAHMDHLGGFQWLMRSRLGEFPPCRLYGPPGLARHIECFINSFLWDRIGNNGPCFEVAELRGQRLHRVRVQAGISGREVLDEIEVTDGVVLDEPQFRVRAVELDHHTPVLAYALELARTINVRKDRLTARGLQPGPWLTELKQQLLAGNPTARVALPDGRAAPAGQLGDELTLVTPGKKMVYATDLADTADNRERLATLARNAHTLFCESAFAEADAEHALKNGHLTTRAAGEIATAARVSRLVPFHFSRRYSDDPQRLYDELKAACARVALPMSMSVFDESPTTDLG